MGQNEELGHPSHHTHPPASQKAALGCTWGLGGTQPLMAASGPDQTSLGAQYHSATSQRWPRSPRRWRGGQVMPGQCHLNGAGRNPPGPRLGYFPGAVQLFQPDCGLAGQAGDLGGLWWGWQGQGAGPTEQSFFWVWIQPERSFWTQQPEARSTSRSLRTSCSICWSFRIQGENFAPRWIRSIWNRERT